MPTLYWGSWLAKIRRGGPDVHWSAKIFFLWKSVIFHSIKLPFDAEVAEKILNGIYYLVANVDNIIDIEQKKKE